MSVQWCPQVSRLKQTWGAGVPELDKDQWATIWADGVYSGLRSEQDKLCALVIIGVNERGEKHFLAIEDGVRESTQSWREVLLKLKSRGMSIPKLAIGDGAMGFWAALEEVYPQTRQQRCWRCDEGNWHRLRGFDYLAKVITGIEFRDGIEVKDVDPIAA